MKVKIVVIVLLLISFSATGKDQAVAKFSSEDELSSVVVGGNSSLKTFKANSKNSYRYKKSLFLLTGDYTYGESADIATVEKWNFGIRYELSLSEKLSSFFSEEIEADRFNGLEKRYNTDLGLKYIFIKSDELLLSSDLAIRHSKEYQKGNSSSDSYLAKIRTDLSQKINAIVSTLFWAEYLPNFSNSDDYLINFGPSITVMMSKVFSLKFSYVWNYDNQPVVGNKKHDYTHTTGLIIKF